MCKKIKSSPSSSDSDTGTQEQTQINFLSTQTQRKSDSPSLSIITAPQPRRRNRTKTRKPKFLSLRLQLSPPPAPSKSNPMTTRLEETHQGQHQQQQLNLFPLHPEKYLVEDNNVALLFCSDACGATLNGVLEAESESPTTSTTTATTNTMTTTTTTTSEEESLSPPSLRYWAFQFGGDYNASLLVKRAMKRWNRETDAEAREEKWVSYSQVVEKKEPADEVTSYCYCTTSTALEGSDEKTMTNTTTFGLSSLNLKLDYDGILSAWSHKGCSLYVGGEPQNSVPHFHPPPKVLWRNACKVGESESETGKGMKEEEMGWKLGKREASLLRYKEKRQSRLFSKQIRYEVRKLNAQKRPRMKGRFVKRD
ncbi:hypothetical protein L6164_005038 [Bauhinia variegata]|uniref:Uncharacterized protein n=1 Tax=Bauhinia variegata TaxID=167791 RepID=A0ACB9PPP7_BAUVA|nr:hypothetical protein L6164_005038 [Bauhinia variegata]